MNTNDNEDPSQIDFAKVPIAALRQPSRSILSLSLNPIKVLPSEEGIPRDWRGVSHLAGIHNLYGAIISADKDPMAKVLSLWCSDRDNETMNVSSLLKLLKKIDRWDVVDDLNESLTEDAKAFKSKKFQEKLITSHTKIVDTSNHLNREDCGRLYENLLLTNDDVQRAEIGLPLQIYDAFLLFADEDANFALEIVERLEKDGFKLCLKDRNLLGGITLEHEAIVRLISQRCNHLIVIMTTAFLKSAANTFFVNYTAVSQIEQGSRKVISCLYEHCELPLIMKNVSHIRYFHSGRFYNFWEKLSFSIRSSNTCSSENDDHAHSNPSTDAIEENLQNFSAPVNIPQNKPGSNGSQLSSMSQISSPSFKKKTKWYKKIFLLKNAAV